MCCASGGKGFTLLVFLLGYHLGLVFVQIKLSIHFLLFEKKHAQRFFMLEGSMELLLVISKGFNSALIFRLFFLRKPIKAAQSVLNTGYRAQSVLGIQIRFVGVCATKIQRWRFPFST